jgi:hypothetical protein
MDFRRTLFVAFAFLPALVCSPGTARAQTASGATLAGSTLKYPDRILTDGTDIGTGPRPQNLTPLGISYADCIQDQSLKFSIAVSGFTGEDIQIWATKSGTCSNDPDRGNGGISKCWPLPGGLAAVNQPALTTYTFTVRVQDIVGPQNASPSPTNYARQGADACATQLSFASQTFSVYFVPIHNGDVATGSAYAYQLPVDLSGPPAPGGIGDQVGDTLFTLTWTPNSDTDTVGYDVFMDRQGAAGSADGSAGAAEAAAASCPDTGVPMTVNDASSADAADDGAAADASTDATTDATAASADSGCVPVSTGGPTMMSKCGDPILSGGIVQDGGSQTTTTDDSGATVTTGGNGGISTVPSSYLVGASGAGLTVSDKSVGTYTITGLANGVTYNAVVSAVDAYGNIGPPSVEQCDYPAPVNDFWTDYRNDGGRAGGGFCALEAVGASPVPSLAGVGLLIGAGAVVRRRRRRVR